MVLVPVLLTAVVTVSAVTLVVDTSQAVSEAFTVIGPAPLAAGVDVVELQPTSQNDGS